MRKFKKRGISVMISIALTALFSMSQMMTVFAADVSAENYVFSLILRACGVSPGTKVGAWQDAYEGNCYLEFLCQDISEAFNHIFRNIAYTYYLIVLYPIIFLDISAV